MAYRPKLRSDVMDAARLAGMPPFADLSREERAEVAARVHEVTVEVDATLALQGDNAYELFVIEEGEAEVLRDGETVATLREGDVFGEVGVLVTGSRRATVVATTPMRLIACPRRAASCRPGRPPHVPKPVMVAPRQRMSGPAVGRVST
jgi:signal-transduction protein with cAMP-binding, CBS, and nucleotidyltransferase domain